MLDASDPRVRRHHRRERHGDVRGRRGGAQERHHGRPLPAESQVQGTPQRAVSRVHDSVRQRVAEAPRQVRIHVPPPAGDSVRQALSGMRAQVHQGRLPEPIRTFSSTCCTTCSPRPTITSWPNRMPARRFWMISVVANDPLRQFARRDFPCGVLGICSRGKFLYDLYRHWFQRNQPSRSHAQSRKSLSMNQSRAICRGTGLAVAGACSKQSGRMDFPEPLILRTRRDGVD